MAFSRPISCLFVLLSLVLLVIAQYPYNYDTQSGTSRVVNGVMDGIDMVLLRFIDIGRKSSLSLQSWGEQIGFLPHHQNNFLGYYNFRK
ncbi:hypothetical protein L596_023214 [Steinernema carpocapsae]|uniref:Uncharacterized protein n=1 Tax=Steinernema carpocapsae TaxID=34508 RepID=A0A4U5MCY9_STECR|nr:hypothetical protein L596_023214 [Steinernema carpocapsae]